MTDVDDVEGITSFKLSFSFGDSIKDAPIKLWNHCDTIPIRKHWKV
ncbi:hypothetical protein AB9K21_01645 [Anaplasma phagocytophilum]|uniref:Uncharacterized protein n=1 Tax=Anaplasma phagocytophilum str. ApNP TaxID=1359153 RepID=A0A0F3NJ00_ANAPH|nr:hypothetical protein APHNP_0401 [Anaplasma phagocytophilum str. ApNP]